MIEESDALDDDCGEFMGEVWRLMKYYEVLREQIS